MLNALRGNLLDKGVRKLVECLSSLSWKKGNDVIKKPQCFCLQLLGRLAELANDADKKFLQNLENGATIWYKSDMWNFPGVFPGATKQRVYDEQRLFLGNSKTAVRKEEALRKAIDKD